MRSRRRAVWRHAVCAVALWGHVVCISEDRVSGTSAESGWCRGSLGCVRLRGYRTFGFRYGRGYEGPENLDIVVFRCIWQLHCTHTVRHTFSLICKYTALWFVLILWHLTPSLSPATVCTSLMLDEHCRSPNSSCQSKFRHIFVLLGEIQFNPVSMDVTELRDDSVIKHEFCCVRPCFWHEHTFTYILNKAARHLTHSGLLKTAKWLVWMRTSPSAQLFINATSRWTDEVD